MNSGKHSLIIGTWTDADSFESAYRAMVNRHRNKDLDGYYNSYASMIHTYYDFKIVPTERPAFAAPEPKTDIVEIPGSDFHLDLSEALTGYPLFGPREGEMEFIALNGYAPWLDRYTDILDFFHGKNNLKIILEDDPGFYYSGRLSVNKEKSDKHNNFLTVDYVLEPYKTRLAFGDKWLWDPFSFETGVIYSSLQYFYIDENHVKHTADSVFSSSGMTVNSNDWVTAFRFPSVSGYGIDGWSTKGGKRFFGRKPVEPKITVEKLNPAGNDADDGKIDIKFMNQDAKLCPGTLEYNQQGDITDFEAGTIHLDANDPDRRVVAGVVFTDQTYGGIKWMRVKGKGKIKIEFIGGEL